MPPVYTYDHIHLRTTNPQATLEFYQKMFDATPVEYVQSNGQPSMSKSAARCCPLFGTQEVKAILSHTGGPVFSMIMDSSWGTNGVPSLFS
jgi:catechol 2,3-dioxygenase-like lactoylglutathione lyase family enzyme